MEKFIEKKEVVIECKTCHREITIMLKSFGYGYVGFCPQCTGLAYNDKKLPATSIPLIGVKKE